MSGVDFYDEDGYPSEQSLNTIRSWGIGDHRDALNLMEFCRVLWRYNDAGGWEQGTEPDELLHRGRTVRVFRLSTFGWSGNEDIIARLREHAHFWNLYWWESRRGGHYEFRITDHGAGEAV